MKKIITIIGVLLGLAVVFYAGMTFKQTIQEDWCMDNGGMIKQAVHDYCVFDTKEEIKSDEYSNDYIEGVPEDSIPIPTLHETWDVNNDGANDCEDEGICDHTIDYSKPRVK